jgi:hypothetical protein
MEEVDSGLTGMIWNGGSQFWTDWNSLSRRTIIFIFGKLRAHYRRETISSSALLIMMEVSFGPTEIY